MHGKAGNSLYIKEYNRCMLLSLIRQYITISYTNLSKITGLAPKSVYEIVNGLIDEGYVMEACMGKSSGGRKPAMLSLRHGSYYSIGIDTDVARIKAVLMDFTGALVYKTEIKAESSDYSYHINMMVSIVQDIINRFNIPQDRLLGVGISVPGSINSVTKKIVMAPNLGWENRDLINDLKEIINYHIYLENEAMASAVCEKWIGECKNDKDFICINILSGIGAGIYASNKPFHGVSGSAGEIGHIQMDRNGPICACKNRGCLETYASTTAILKRAEEKYNRTLSIDEVIALAKESDRELREIFEVSAGYLGLAISYLVNTFNPSKIVLGKDFVKFSELMLDTIINKVKSTTIKNNYEPVSIKVSNFGEDASVFGASILPVITLFEI